MSFRELSEIIEMLYPERAIMCTTPRFRKFSSSSSGRLDRSPIVSPARKELCGSGRTLERFSIKECFVENKNFFNQNLKNFAARRAFQKFLICLHILFPDNAEGLIKS